MTTPKPDLSPRHSANSSGAPRRRPPPVWAGDPFAALLLENDRQRESAVAALLSGVGRPGTRVIRVANIWGTPLTLGRILLQSMAPGDVIPAVEDPRLLVAAIVEPQRPATRVVLLIEQAELINPDALRSLQAMAPYFAKQGQPSLRVVFVGRPSFRDLLRCEELLPLRQALAQSTGAPSDISTPPPPDVELASVPPPISGLFEPVAARFVPQRWHIAGLAMAMLVAAYYVGLREPPRRFGPLTPAPALPAIQPLTLNPPMPTASPLARPASVPPISQSPAFPPPAAAKPAA